MAIGRVERSDGTTASGFLCEPAALDDAEDITSYGGWRAYGNRCGESGGGPGGGSARMHGQPSAPGGGWRQDGTIGTEGVNRYG